MTNQTDYLLDKLEWKQSIIDDLRAILAAERAGRLAEIRSDIALLNAQLDREIECQA